ncbi:head maturation protease, ClpP-related [Brevundimonas pondensis]|uniref:head maturation protease, ClpP-related n=1 Tax=Brevundimonas pondensis TaxID=2774189 RepID=UPI001A9DC213|nr:head maturation protease, ClpP-related [Brevundimonas pondensis]
MPARKDVHAFTGPEVFDRWSEDAAGVRALERGDNVITMFDVIGEDYWTGGGVTAKKVASQLRAITGPVEVQINSPGGDMFEGFAIYNVLREHPHEVTVKVMGMAASAASIITMAGDRIEIGASSFIMIHNCWVLAFGNRNDLRELADWLAPFDQAMCDVYVAHTGQDAKTVAKMLDDETWLSGSQAIDKGFADALLASDKITVDENAKSEDRRVNELRGMERSLISAGMSRDAARARIDRIRGARDAAPDPATRDAGASGLSALLDNLTATIRA